MNEELKIPLQRTVPARAEAAKRARAKADFMAPTKTYEIVEEKQGTAQYDTRL